MELLQWQSEMRKAFSGHMHPFSGNGLLRQKVLLSIEVCEGPIELVTRSPSWRC